jgi:hypothetical protein
MAYCIARPLHGSPIAKALGLEGRRVESLTIHLSDDAVSTVEVKFSLTEDQEAEVARSLKGCSLSEVKQFFLLERKA